MDISRAFGYAFQDEEWTAKLGIAALLAFFGSITLPVLLGLALWAILLGYQTELIRNLRDGQPKPLPRWEHYDRKITLGARVITAYFVYNLPNLLLVCCVATTASFWGDNFFGSTIGWGVWCCLGPLLLVYNLVTWPMLALGMARYAEEHNIGVFFQFGDLFETARQHLNVTLQWALYTLAANFLIGLLAVIPCIGWAVASALWLSVQGYLTAGLARQIETPLRGPAKPKRSLR